MFYYVKQTCLPASIVCGCFRWPAYTCPYTCRVSSAAIPAVRNVWASIYDTGPTQLWVLRQYEEHLNFSNNHERSLICFGWGG